MSANNPRIIAILLRVPGHFLTIIKLIAIEYKIIQTILVINCNKITPFNNVSLLNSSTRVEMSIVTPTKATNSK